MLFMQEMLWGDGGGSGGPATISYRTAASSASDLTTYTFSSQDIGTASSARRVIVGVVLFSSAARTVSSVTVGGISATEAVAISDSFFSNHVRAALWIADVPTGATADVVLTASGACVSAGVSIWAADGLASSTASATATNQEDPLVIDLNTTAGGIVAAISIIDTATTATWTGLTEHFDLTVGDTGDWSAASVATATASSPLAVTCNWAASGNCAAGVAAAWSAA
jgi:hypothetical protein